MSPLQALLPGLSLNLLPTGAAGSFRTWSALQRGELRAGDGAKAGTGWVEKRGHRLVDWWELEGTGKVGMEWRTAEQRAWDGTVQGSAGSRAGWLLQHRDIQLVPFLFPRISFFGGWLVGFVFFLIQEIISFSLVSMETSL